ncbi:dienelactone hydrolase family protein [Maricaulis maris]|uniref:Dienelactone hydrolase n=1 Tax=Maricaulis maris TaxID=74318 RepID=A0A495D466_9PROT|nr:dienelactone hydrolase family protein [Maricaulis maris]RKQ96696.1 dienelactone hydrolase [Maricaulis maris]
MPNLVAVLHRPDMTMKLLLRGGAAIAALTLTALAASATGNASGVTTPTRSLDAQVELLHDHVETRLPLATTGPVPTVIMLHGCGGLRQVQLAYAEDVLAAGYGVIIVDSLSPRGIDRFGAMSQVCTALRLWGQERAADIPAVIAMAHDNPAIDADRLALVGWSHGGWTVLEALDFAAEGRASPAIAPQPDAPLDGVRLAVTMYPYCGFPVRADGRAFPDHIPLRAILAERDMIAPHRDCERLFDRSDAAGIAVDFEVWDGLTHAFDEPNPPPDPRIEYNAGAAQRARAQLVSWLDEAFADQG